MNRVNSEMKCKHFAVLTVRSPIWG